MTPEERADILRTLKHMLWILDNMEYRKKHIEDLQERLKELGVKEEDYAQELHPEETNEIGGNV